MGGKRIGCGCGRRLGLEVGSDSGTDSDLVALMALTNTGMSRGFRLSIAGGLMLVVSLTVGLGLASYTRADTSGCLHVRGPCDPRITAPYVWPGLIVVAAGSFVGLVLLAFGIRRWAQVRA